MKLILIFSILVSVINVMAAESAISCVTCKVIGNGVDNCCSEVQQCAEGGFCVTQIESNTLGKEMQTIRKKCMPKDQERICNRIMVLNTTDEFQIYMFSKCCFTDGCNKEGIKVPPINMTENGRVCQSCFVQGETKCTKFGKIRCTGNQFQCFNYAGPVTFPGQCEKPFQYQGCVTTGACLVDFQNLPGVRGSVDAEYSCVDAPKS